MSGTDRARAVMQVRAEIMAFMGDAVGDGPSRELRSRGRKLRRRFLTRRRTEAPVNASYLELKIEILKDQRWGANTDLPQSRPSRSRRPGRMRASSR